MDPFSLGLGIAGIGASLFGQNNTNKMQMQMMQQQQAFQQQMSNTAYQRASTDMQAAGLNPMMMFSSGSAASTPAGATPSPSVKSGLDSDSITKNISTAVQSKVAAATIENLVEQNAKIKAETLTEGRRPGLVSSQSVATARHGERAAADTYRIRAGMPVILNEALRAENEASIPKSVRRGLDMAGYGGRKLDDIISPVGNVISSAVGAKRLRPSRSTLEREQSDHRGTSRTFEERFHY
nr:MAG: DNA pilot protein [Microvirus sp.]